MRIAYIVSAYRLPDQLVRLVRRLHAPEARFAIHVDRKTDDAIYERMRSGLAGLDRVDFLERHVSHWGGFGHVEATLKGIAHAVGSGEPFDYAVLLTGQDYPLRAPGAIAEFLSQAEGRSFMNHWRLPHPGWSGRGGLDRLERWHWIAYRRRLHVSLPLRRRLPGALEPWGGGPYWCLAGPAVHYVHDFVAENPAFVRFFRHVFVPDELFFQTILMNSPLRDTVVNDNLRYLDWAREPAPAVLELRDLPAMIASEKLFARKFDAGVDARVLDELDRVLDGSVPA